VATPATEFVLAGVATEEGHPYKNGPFSALNTGLDSSALNLYYAFTLS